MLLEPINSILEHCLEVNGLVCVHHCHVSVTLALRISQGLILDNQRAEKVEELCAFCGQNLHLWARHVLFEQHDQVVQGQGFIVLRDFLGDEFKVVFES